MLPVLFISESTARAVMSRGARDLRGSYLCMNSLPSAPVSTPPSPRTASEMRKDRASAPSARVLKKQVGWNWTNSMLAIVAPARHAMATPSPVAESLLVVYRYTRPQPPVASRTRSERKISTSPELRSST